MADDDTPNFIIPHAYTFGEVEPMTDTDDKSYLGLEFVESEDSLPIILALDPEVAADFLAQAWVYNEKLRIRNGGKVRVHKREHRRLQPPV